MIPSKADREVVEAMTLSESLSESFHWLSLRKATDIVV